MTAISDVKEGSLAVLPAAAARVDWAEFGADIVCEHNVFARGLVETRELRPERDVLREGFEPIASASRMDSGHVDVRIADL